jgi:hypothetical protein
LKFHPKVKKICTYLIGFFALVGVYSTTNTIYHVVNKPTEIIGVFDTYYYKNPQLTWETYSSQFRKYSTPIITADFLAALAQAETGGNAIARTYWQWNLMPKHIFDIYAPASSAVGLYQITDGAFEEAQNYCVYQGKISVKGTADECPTSKIYNRLKAEDSIEMTSAHLHLSVKKVLQKNHLRKVALRRKQDLAVIIHLCGINRADRYIKEHFRFAKDDQCGASHPAAYVTRVHRFAGTFKRYDDRDRKKEMMIADGAVDSKAPAKNVLK